MPKSWLRYIISKDIPKNFERPLITLKTACAYIYACVCARKLDLVKNKNVVHILNIRYWVVQVKLDYLANLYD